jgi:hypothetical protein
MCSGCSGNYEADGEGKEMHRQNYGEKRPRHSRRFDVSAGARNQRGNAPALEAVRSNFEIGGSSSDNYDVFVTEDRIVEIRRIGRFSPNARSPARHSQLSAGEKRPIFKRLGGGSAKDYGTPQANDTREVLRFEVGDNWRDPRDLSAFDRFTRAVRRLLR